MTQCCKTCLGWTSRCLQCRCDHITTWGSTPGCDVIRYVAQKCYRLFRLTTAHLEVWGRHSHTFRGTHKCINTPRYQHTQLLAQRSHTQACIASGNNWLRTDTARKAR